MNHAARLKGRPPTVRSGRRVNVFLDERTIERARLLGEGSISAGIRRALSASPKPNQITMDSGVS